MWLEGGTARMDLSFPEYASVNKYIYNFIRQKENWQQEKNTKNTKK